MRKADKQGKLKQPVAVFAYDAQLWCPRQDSNLELLLRTELFYPLNYRGVHLF
jgi:hypothetical protein